MTYNNLNNNNKKKKNGIVAPTMTLGALITIIMLVSVSVLIHVETADAILPIDFPGRTSTKAPAVVSGDNIYIAWWTNNTENGNEEVMFRASSDGGATFSDKINLSNSSDADSWRVEIHGEGDTVVVSWWETNQTSDIPVARVSNDAGETFGPMMMLGTNGTISGTEEEGAAAAEGGEGEGE
jgi:hypothetical protein